MNLQYVLLAAKTMADKGEKEAEHGLPNASQSFKMAAKKYKEAAAIDPANSAQYLSMAESLEQKSTAPISTVKSGSSQTANKADTNKANTTNNKTQRSSATQTKPATQTQTAEAMSVEECLNELNSFIGLTNVKNKVNAWVAQIKMNKKREEMHLPVAQGFSYHLVFTGNPGTGKTTVARIMADIYRSLGILQTGQLVETSRSDLVAGYEGQTGERTRAKIEEALGGVLFVDEAYTLCGNGRDSGKDPFGQEAIDELLKAMEDHRNDLVVIAAGYSDLMEKFLNSNPGLKSRMTNVIEFEDYNPDEMLQILKKSFSSKDCEATYKLTDKAEVLVKKYFTKLYRERDINFGNARTVRNFFQAMYQAQSVRLDALALRKEVTFEDMRCFDESDVTKAMNNDNGGVYAEYENVKNDFTDANIMSAIEKGEYGNVAISICSRLEGLFKYVYKENGDLCEMINSFCQKNGATFGLTNSDYNLLHKIRMYRNSFVHSGSEKSDITSSDALKCLAIIKKLEK